MNVTPNTLAQGYLAPGAMPHIPAPPRVSVLMSVHNGERYLRAAVESMLSQTFRAFEFIIVDDASTDATWSMLSAYARQDRRIVLVQNHENIGLTKALNTGLQIARGEYIARQDADDIALPQRLERQVAFLDAHPNVVLVACNLDLIDETDRFLVRQERAGDPGLVAWCLLFYNHLGGHSQVVFRREPVARMGGYAETCRYSQDYELWSRLVQRGDIVVLPDVLQQWRTHSEGISTRNRSQQQDYSLDTACRNLAQCTGSAFSPQHVVELRAFWLGPAFPDCQRAHALHATLRQIYRAFLRQRAAQRGHDPQLARQLRSLIGSKFFAWGLTIDARRQPRAKLALARYACTWNPPGFLKTTLRALKLRLARNSALYECTSCSHEGGQQ